MLIKIFKQFIHNSNEALRFFEVLRTSAMTVKPTVNTTTSVQRSVQPTLGARVTVYYGPASIWLLMPYTFDWFIDWLIDWLIDCLRTFIRAGWVILIMGPCIKNPSHFLNDCNFNRIFQKHPNLILVLVLLRNWPNSKQTRCFSGLKTFLPLTLLPCTPLLEDHIISWWNPSPPQIETAGSMIARRAATKATSATFTFQKIHFGILHILIM